MFSVHSLTIFIPFSSSLYKQSFHVSLQSLFTSILFNNEEHGAPTCLAMASSFHSRVGFHFGCWNFSSGKFSTENEFTTMPTIVVFRCLEAMYDTSLNTAVEASLQNYTIYYASLVNQVWDTKTNQRVHVTSTEFCSNLKTIFSQYMIVSVVRSYLSACQFQPFCFEYRYTRVFHFVSTGSLANNYCMALLTFYTLCVAFNLTGFVTGNLMGYSVKDVLYNPLVSTRSPRDFWRATMESSHWWSSQSMSCTCMSYEVLYVSDSYLTIFSLVTQRAAFLPVRQYCSARVAIVATFFIEWFAPRLFLGMHLLSTRSQVQ